MPPQSDVELSPWLKLTFWGIKLVGII